MEANPLVRLLGMAMAVVTFLSILATFWAVSDQLEISELTRVEMQAEREFREQAAIREARAALRQPASGDTGKGEARVWAVQVVVDTPFLGA